VLPTTPVVDPWSPSEDGHTQIRAEQPPPVKLRRLLRTEARWLAHHPSLASREGLGQNAALGLALRPIRTALGDLQHLALRPGNHAGRLPSTSAVRRLRSGQYMHVRYGPSLQTSLKRAWDTSARQACRSSRHGFCTPLFREAPGQIACGFDRLPLHSDHSNCNRPCLAILRRRRTSHPSETTANCPNTVWAPGLRLRRGPFVPKGRQWARQRSIRSHPCARQAGYKTARTLPCGSDGWTGKQYWRRTATAPWDPSQIRRPGTLREEPPLGHDRRWTTRRSSTARVQDQSPPKRRLPRIE